VLLSIRQSKVEAGRELSWWLAVAEPKSQPSSAGIGKILSDCGCTWCMDESSTASTS